MKKSISIVVLALPLLTATLLVPTEDGYAKGGGDRRDDRHDGGRGYGERDRYERDERHERHERDERHERQERYERHEREEHHERKERHEDYRVIERGAIPGGEGALPPKYGSE